MYPDAYFTNEVGMEVLDFEVVGGEGLFRWAAFGVEAENLGGFAVSKDKSVSDPKFTHGVESFF